MLVPDDPVKPGKASLVSLNDAQLLILKNQQPAVGFAKRAAADFHLRQLNQHPFDTAVVGSRYISGQPVSSKNLAGHFNHNIVSFQQAVLQIIAVAG